MKVPKGDGGKPIEYGDSSYISDGIYNPIIWVGKEAYRPRVETLVIRENNKVFLRLYDKKKNNSYYTLPGGSVDADSTKIQQAENETNEEALVSIKDIYYTGIQYYDRYAPGFIRSGGNSPIEYMGTINDVYVAKYAGVYDKSKVEPKDLDPDIADNGKFYHIPSVLKYLRPEHVRALAECPFVEPLTKMRINLYMADNSAAITESLSPDFDTVLPPNGGYLYHGSRFKIDVFHPMSVDFGNAKQKPGWSTFCFADPTLALRFGLMRTIQNEIGDKYHCEWNFEKKKPFLYIHEFNEAKPLIIGEKFYVHHIPTEGLDIGIGNDIRFPEYTFREDNVYPKFITSYTIDDVILQAHVELMGMIEFGDYTQRFLKNYDAFKDRHYAAFINRDYAHDPIIKKVNDAISRKELQPGDDVEQFMIDHNLIPEDIVWSRLTEAVTIKTALRPITKNNYERYKKENPKSMIRHMREPNDVNQGYFMVSQHDKLIGYVMVDTSRQLIIALEVMQAYRGLGMGEELLDIARTKLNAKFLTVNKKNIPAIKLYEKHGWKTYKEDGSMYYMSAPGVTFTMEGYNITGTGMSAMVPVTEKRLTAADRKNIPGSDYGIPSLRKYPMPDKKHVLSAIHYFNSVEPKHEKELARNILRKIDEYGMKEVVHVGKDNRFSKYVDKSMVQESYTGVQELFERPAIPKSYLNDLVVQVIGTSESTLINDDGAVQEVTYRTGDIVYQNFEKFESGECNYCFVTGLSGSGKSTLANKLCKDYDAIWIELDVFLYGDKVVDHKTSKVWSPEYPFVHFVKQHPKYRRLMMHSTSEDEWSLNLNFYEDTREFIRFTIDWCKKRKNKRYVIEGVQIFIACDKDTLENEPIIIVDRSVATAYFQRARRDVGSGYVDILTELRYTPKLINYYVEDIMNLRKFKRNVLEESFIDIDEVPPGKGEKSYGIPDGRSQGNDPDGYESFVVSKYLHHGEYFGLTDWEKSISDYIEKKNYDRGLYYLYGNNNGYPEYLGPIIVHGNRQWNMYREASPMAVTESWDNTMMIKGGDRMLYTEVMELFGLSKKEKEEKKRNQDDLDRAISELKLCISKNGIMSGKSENCPPHPGIGFAYADTKEADLKKHCESIKTNDLDDFIDEIDDTKVINFIKGKHFVDIGTDYGGVYWFYCKETGKIYTYDDEDPSSFISSATTFSSIKAEGGTLLKRDKKYVEADKAMGENRIH